MYLRARGTSRSAGPDGWVRYKSTMAMNERAGRRTHGKPQPPTRDGGIAEEDEDGVEGGRGEAEERAGECQGA